ncbi:MAG TPA: sporulation protein YpjB [Bacillota bacterium]|nr:sporulation protein YpjB [Bacillota bacterium]
MMELLLTFNKFPIIMVHKFSNIMKTTAVKQLIFTEVVKEEKPQNMTTFFIAVSLIGGMIVLTLAYVSWRKYIAEQKKKRSKQ